MFYTVQQHSTECLFLIINLSDSENFKWRFQGVISRRRPPTFAT